MTPGDLPEPRAARALLAPLTLLAVLAAGCSSGGQSRPSEPAAGGEYPAASGFPPGWTAEPLDWSACDLGTAQGECATLAVPLDWDDTSGEQIDLALARIPATGDRIGPLLVNPGGPGGSGVEWVGGLAGTTFGERFDLVSWDPRGVGSSAPIDCEGTAAAFLALDPEPDDEAEQARLEAAADAVSRDCEADGGDLLAHVTTPEVARDMEAIRLALGGEPLNYLGLSYGTLIGQWYAELFGGQVRAMVLDGVVDPSQGFEEFLLAQAEAFETAFTRQAGGCREAGERACGVADLTAAHDELAARLEEQPLPGAGPAELATGTVLTAYREGGWAQLGPALAAGLEGDGRALSDLAEQYWSLAAYGPYAGVICTDDPPPEGVEAYRDFARRAAEASPRFGAAVANELLPCATWAVPPQGSAGAITAPDAPDVLVIGNTGDPATPLDNARSVADSLVRGHLLVVESDGHTALGIPCATGLVESYLFDLALPGEGVTC